MKGRYANMWRKQIRAERAAEAASQMVAKANALQKAAMERPGSSGNEGGPSEDVSENEADNRTLAQSRELQPDESARDVASPTGDSHADDTLMGSIEGDGDSNAPSDPADDPQANDTLKDSRPDDADGNGASYPTHGPKRLGSGSEGSP